MGEVDPTGQRGRSMMEVFDRFGYFPATVHDHTDRQGGMTLHTIGDDPDTDIEIYDDGRESHRSGNPLEEE